MTGSTDCQKNKNCFAIFVFFGDFYFLRAGSLGYGLGRSGTGRVARVRAGSLGYGLGRSGIFEVKIRNCPDSGPKLCFLICGAGVYVAKINEKIVRPSVRSVVRSSVRSFVRPFVRSFVRSFVRARMRSDRKNTKKTTKTAKKTKKSKCV